jgi:inner membrane protein
MDPLTQGVVGAVAAQQPAKRSQLLAVTMFGFLSGMAPDLDVLISSSEDPLLTLEFHRQFTHSLIFIPIGSLLCALFFRLVLYRWRGFKNNEITFLQTWFYCALGYATHGLLDACTTYGTQLLWPFSHARIAWNTISIIDPVFTLPLCIFIVAAVIKKSKYLAHFALAWVVLYSLLGIYQRERAQAVGLELAVSRGHKVIRLEAKPSFANILLWKVVYETETKFYVDAIKVGLKKRTYEGASIAKLNVPEAFPWLEPDSQQAKDIERFRWFSNGYVAVSPQFSNRIIDIRYSLIPNEINGLWGIELDVNADANKHVQYVTNRYRDDTTSSRLWEMITE